MFQNRTKADANKTVDTFYLGFLGKHDNWHLFQQKYRVKNTEVFECGSLERDGKGLKRVLKDLFISQINICRKQTQAKLSAQRKIANIEIFHQEAKEL